MKTNILLLVLIYTLFSCHHTAKEADQSYLIETITMPEGLTAEVAALDFLPDGRLVAAFMRGEVMIYDPKKSSWSLFATGLHEPLGMLVVDDKEILIMQLPELTRIRDTDGDGIADDYETVYDDFGMTANYHEFAYGPVKDSKGNLYIALNSASSGGDISPEVRGTYNADGKGKQRAMFAVVPYRGWIMKITPEGKAIPFASGFRSPNGLVLDKNDNLYVTDNQGDWVASSPLYHVREGQFYGHPASLVWDDRWNKGNPFEWSTDSLDQLRDKPAVIFPHDVIANSPTQPIVVRKGMNMDHFLGQLLIGEMNTERIVRVMLEDIDGMTQGATTILLQGQGLRKGNNRLAIAPDGSLWTGQTDHGWLGDRGIQKIIATNRVPFDIKNIRLEKDGFELEFTKPFSDFPTSDITPLLAVKKYNYHYHAKYGSPRINETEVRILQATEDHKTNKLKLNLGKMEKGFVYEIKIDSLYSKDRRDTLTNKIVAYTVKKTK